MSAQTRNPIESGPWQAQRIRATTFLSPDSEIDNNSVWSIVVGGIPDEEQRRPKEGSLHQVGTQGDFTIVLRILHPRVDWLVQPIIQRPEEPSVPPDWQAASFSDALKALSRIASQWLSMQLQVARVAFGAHLVQPANDIREASSRLSDYLTDMKIDSDNSYDFFFQINRPRESKTIPQLRINRLSKWSIMTQATGGFDIQVAPGVEDRVSLSPITQRYASSLELDINTLANYEKYLPQPQLNNLFEELMDSGKEIAVQGDVP